MNKVPEYWLDVPGSIKYQVSNYGNFRRKLKNRAFRPIKTFIKKQKWVHVKVDFNGIYKEYLVHRIVAAVFLDKPKDLTMVLHHKNMMIRDNYAGNLEWISKEGLGRKTGGNTGKIIPVIKFDKDTGEILDFYKSVQSAAKYNYIHKSTIYQALRGDLKTAAGYVWKRESIEFE